MVDLLIQISCTSFLGYFIFFAIGSMIVTWFLIHADGSRRYPLPAMTALQPFEIAALRNGRKGVIQAALFNLWKQELIATSGKRNTIKVRRKAITDWEKQKPKDEIEKIIYEFVYIARKPRDFFNDVSLRLHLNKGMVSINQTLEKLHLKRTSFQMKRAWKIFWILFFVVASVGSTKLVLDISVGRWIESLVTFLTLISLILINFILLVPESKTTLGVQYQQKLKKHFEWIKYQPNNQDIDPVFQVALFGVIGIAEFSMFADFERAFTKLASPGTEDGGCGAACGGGGCGGGGCGGGG